MTFAKTVVAASLFAVCCGAQALADEMAPCRSAFRMNSQAEGESPGSLSTARDTPCRLAIAIGGGRRAGSGVAAGVTFPERPKNGAVKAEGNSALIYTPRKGFAGSDMFVMQFNWRNGSRARVRFAVAVDG